LKSRKNIRKAVDLFGEAFNVGCGIFTATMYFPQTLAIDPANSMTAITLAAVDMPSIAKAR
jgi:hypothetical protein